MATDNDKLKTFEKDVITFSGYSGKVSFAQFDKYMARYMRMRFGRKISEGLWNDSLSIVEGTRRITNPNFELHCRDVLDAIAIFQASHVKFIHTWKLSILDERMANQMATGRVGKDAWRDFYSKQGTSLVKGISAKVVDGKLPILEGNWKAKNMERRHHVQSYEWKIAILVFNKHSVARRHSSARRGCRAILPYSQMPSSAERCLST